MNPDTGQFSTLDTLRNIFKADSNEEVSIKLRGLGWMELGVGEIIKIKGNDFEVKWIGKDAVLIQSVKVNDPSAKKGKVKP